MEEYLAQHAYMNAILNTAIVFVGVLVGAYLAEWFDR